MEEYTYFAMGIITHRLYFIKNSEAPPQTDELMRNIYGWRGEAMQYTGYLMLDKILFRLLTFRHVKRLMDIPINRPGRYIFFEWHIL
jgi:hypothetical protein